MKESKIIKEKKTFDFLGIDVECLLTDTPPEDFHQEAEGGVYGAPVKDDPTTFRVWFKGLIKDTTFVHECWHLYFAIMKYIDTRIHTFDELYEEIYAYTFHSLYLKLVETITHMKTYHKFWEEKKKSSKKNESHFVVEIADNHGRMIDADKLTDTIVRCINDAEKEYPKEDFELVKMVYESCLYHISKAQTISEANT